MNNMTFVDLLIQKDGLIKGPFGGDIKKSLFVPKSPTTYKVYEQGVVLNRNINYGDYYLTQEYVENNLKRFQVKENDILLTGAGTTGELFIVPQHAPRGVINQALLRIRLNHDVITQIFFYYYFKYYIKSVIGNINGDSVIPNLPPLPIIKSTKIDIPDTLTQQKIANVLFALDSKIELNNKINAELEAMAKTLYEFWFVQFDFPDVKGKSYKTNGGKMVWNAELKREIPDRWEVGALLDIADYVNGLPCQKYRPTGSDSLRVIKIKEMHEGFSTETEFVRANIPQKVIIENGDVLFSWSASLEVLIWSKGKGALNQHIFKVTSDKYPKSFYFFQLINYLQHFKMMAENRKTTMGHITQEHLQQSRIVLPSKELALKLEEIIAPILEKKINNEIENQKLVELRNWLLPMLMNGQITVN